MSFICPHGQGISPRNFAEQSIEQILWMMSVSLMTIARSFQKEVSSSPSTGGKALEIAVLASFR
jgi:hypothetical protein